MPGALTIKVIEPEKLKIDKIRLSFLNGMHKVRREMLRDFQETTKTWEHEVVFESAISEALGGPSVHVITNDEIYRYVNDGTKPHKIPQWRPGPLRFQWGGKGSYKPKTKPRVIGSTPGGPSGPWVTFKKVQHPGTKARKFDEEIQRKWEPTFEKMMTEAMEKAAVDSGHGMP